MQCHFLNFETCFPDILFGFPPFPQNLREQQLAILRDNSFLTISNISVDDNHTVEAVWCQKVAGIYQSVEKPSYGLEGTEFESR